MTLIFSGSMCTPSLFDDVSTEGYSTLEECGFIDAGKELVLTE